MLTMENENVFCAPRKITFPSDTDNLTKVEQLIDKVCEELSIKEDQYGNVLISLTEAVTNAIQHGNQGDVSKEVSVEFKLNKKDFSFKIKDQGKGFDFYQLPDPTDPENIDKPNGRGVFLMRNLADDIVFHDGGSSVELIFKIS
jgi:serine/threonine-protein kinase RsbW